MSFLGEELFQLYPKAKKVPGIIHPRVFFNKTPVQYLLSSQYGFFSCVSSSVEQLGAFSIKLHLISNVNLNSRF